VSSRNNVGSLRFNSASRASVGKQRLDCRVIPTATSYRWRLTLGRSIFFHTFVQLLVAIIRSRIILTFRTTSLDASITFFQFPLLRPRKLLLLTSWSWSTRFSVSVYVLLFASMIPIIKRRLTSSFFESLERIADSACKASWLPAVPLLARGSSSKHQSLVEDRTFCKLKCAAIIMRRATWQTVTRSEEMAFPDLFWLINSHSQKSFDL